MDIVEAQDASPYETILEVGAEGGSLQVMATRTLPTQYAAFLDDRSLLMIDEGEAIHRRSPWGSWRQAFQALGRYPWPKLSPVRMQGAGRACTTRAFPPRLPSS